MTPHIAPAGFPFLEKQQKINLGIIGISEGNGHPYSWSAILNGYDPEHMVKCGFPAIPQYLAEQNWPDAKLSDAEVTHIWTQNEERSRHIAQASLIPHVTKNACDMIGKVDAILLARDDAQSHSALAKPFLEAGLPIYIDKPFALSRDSAVELFQRQLYDGQIFTCTALRFAPELQLSPAQAHDIGPIRFINATTPKYWDTYAVHLIEPTLRIIGFTSEVTDKNLLISKGVHQLSLLWKNDIITSFTVTGRILTPVSISVFGEKDKVDLEFHNSFRCFRNTLEEFLTSIRERKRKIPEHETLKVVEVIENGRN
ncbi:Gfo/Idh/MocA family oxidoreductase [Thalassospira sp. GB04J01]|uniref:Gfo/Idh/MocA family oxidoreductase n=1 Tax=Thalassospira sp. GB04J01 TaxID=1485225 RepID=UPI000C9CB49D|nr:Gfo/Idh/MocA family oxidoreductase [Thalassospira sp. GB04J01]|tara:strand:- start:99753 stop:100691 length:939 start_codon:yes stop_codon:yes gene_type:complete